MRRIAANYVFPVTSPPIKNGIVEVSEEGYISNIIHPGETMKELRKTEFYNGIIVPGFINCHCHLELSALKGEIEPGKGLSRFIQSVRKKRKEISEEKLRKAIQGADEEMKRNGIVAVGDISNTEDAFLIKRESGLFYYTFVEVYGATSSKATENMENFWSLHATLTNHYNLHGNLTPHSAYTIHSNLFQRVVSQPGTPEPIFSFHHQECAPGKERKMKWLIQIRNIKTFSDFLDLFMGIAANKNPVGITKFPGNKPLLLIHNIYTKESDIQFAQKQFTDLYWIVCPLSNLYIGNKTPGFKMLDKNCQNIAVGTDSLASNHQLSILDELLTIQTHYPEVSMEKLIQWATINGARALKIDQQFGSIETGKQPGLNLLSGIDFANLKFKRNASVKRIL
jgi:cytosine/adenosine deaminase-related metal-dependent hydrolase